MCWQLEGLSSGCETACGKWTLQICLARFWESNQKIFFFSWKILFWIFHALIWNVFSHYFDILTERRILFLLLIYDRITHSMLFFKKKKKRIYHCTDWNTVVLLCMRTSLLQYNTSTLWSYFSLHQMLSSSAISDLNAQAVCLWRGFTQKAEYMKHICWVVVLFCSNGCFHVQLNRDQCTKMTTTWFRLFLKCTSSRAFIFCLLYFQFCL